MSENEYIASNLHTQDFSVALIGIPDKNERAPPSVRSSERRSRGNKKLPICSTTTAFIVSPSQRTAARAPVDTYPLEPFTVRHLECSRSAGLLAYGSTTSRAFPIKNEKTISGWQSLATVSPITALGAPRSSTVFRDAERRGF